MKKAFFLIIAMAFMISANRAFAQTGSTVAFKDYLQQVLEYYPSLKKEYASIEKALSAKALAASAKVPQLWASAKTEYGDDPVYVFGALLRQNRFSSGDFDLGKLNSPSPRTDYSAGIEGQWLLFDFAQTASRVKSAGFLADSARFQAQFTKMEAILAASEVYSRLASVQELLKTVQEIAEAGAQDVAAAKSLSAKGLALGADFYLARMTQNKLIQMNNELVAQQAALSMAFNIFRGTDPALAVKVSLDFKKQFKAAGTAQEWMAKASARRPDIEALGKILQAQGVELDREKDHLKPKISAYGHADGNTARLDQSGGGNYVLGFKATVDLFDPGHGARVKMAKAELDRLQNQWQEARDQSMKDTAETFYRLQALSDNVQLARQSFDDARQALELMAPLYREGRRSIDQMVAVRAAVVEANERWLKLETASRQSMLALKFYTGELDSEQAGAIYGQ